MSVPVALILIDDRKTKGYVQFRTKLQKISGQVTVIDLNNIDNPIYTGSTYAEKLRNVINKCQAVLLICTEKLKNFLDSGTPCGNKYLKQEERDIILHSFQQQSNKIILVALSENGKLQVPNSMAVVDKPTMDITTIDAKIKAMR